MNWLYWISLIFEFYCIGFPAKEFSGQKCYPNYKDLLFLCGYLLFSPLLVNTATLGLIAQAYLFAYVMVSWNKLAPPDRAILFLLSTLTALIVEVLVSIVLMVLPVTLSKDYYDLIGCLGSFLVLVLLMRIPFLRSLYGRLCHAALPAKLVLINTYLVIIGIMVIYKLSQKFYYAILVEILFALLLLLLTNICVLYYDQRSRIASQQLIAYRKNLPIYESLITDIRASQHEYANHLQALHQLGHTCQTYEELRDALDRYTEGFAQPMAAYPLLLIDKPLLAASLYSLVTLAQAEEITIQFSIGATQITSPASETQMADLCSALLQNAIEASKAGDRIIVRIFSEDGHLDYEVRNPVLRKFTQEEIGQFFKKGYTTKQRTPEESAAHGLGLYQAQRLLDRLGGRLFADCAFYEDRYYIMMRIHV